MFPTNSQAVDSLPYSTPWLPDKIFTWNPQGIYTTHYRLHQNALIHYSSHHILNHHILEVLPSPQNQQFYKSFEETLTTKRPQATSLTFPKPNPCRAIVLLLPTDHQIIGLVKDIPIRDPLTIINHDQETPFDSTPYTLTIQYPESQMSPTQFSPFSVPEIWRITIQHLADQCGLQYHTPKSETGSVTIRGPLQKIHKFFEIWKALHP